MATLRNVVSDLNFSSSQNTTLEIVDQVIADTDQDVIKMREDIQNMWVTCSTKRERRSQASQQIPGFTMAGDNVGKSTIYLLYDTTIMFT